MESTLACPATLDPGRDARRTPEVPPAGARWSRLSRRAHPFVARRHQGHRNRAVAARRPSRGAGRQRHRLATGTLPSGNVVESAPTRLWKPTPARLGERHARPVDPYRDRPRRGVRPSMATTQSDRRADPPSGGRCAPTSRPPSCTRTRSGTARASSPPTGRSSSGPARTPAARPRTSSSSTSRRAATTSGGARSTGRSARRTTTACAPGSSRTARTATCTRRTASSGPHPGHRRSLRVYTETAWASMFARNLFRRPSRRAARRVPAQLHDHLRPVVQGGPGDRGHADRDRDPGPPPADGDHHRRHRVRRRDQEERVHGHERPAARRGRPADALGGQRRRGGRLGRSSSGSRGPARRRCRPTRCAASSATTSTAGATTGVFNFEGGCYAKTIRLSPMYEPDIFQTTRRFGTVLENVDLDPRTRELDLVVGAVHGEHPGRLPARVHRQRRPDRASPASRATSCS